jgi:hypothetical protein
MCLNCGCESNAEYPSLSLGQQLYSFALCSSQMQPGIAISELDIERSNGALDGLHTTIEGVRNKNVQSTRIYESLREWRFRMPAARHQ